MQELNHNELIEKYLDDSLSPAEQSAFDEAMKDPSFRESLLFRAKLLDELNAQFDQEILEQIKRSSKSKTTEYNKQNTFQYLQAFKIAAAILLLLTAIYFINPYGKANHDKQFDQYMIDYPVELVERGGTSDDIKSQEKYKATLKVALKAYSENRYEEAIESFEKIEDPDQKLQLNLASSYLRTKSTSKAIEILRPLCSSRDAKVADNANWYLALAYVQQNDIQRAIDLLNVISKSDDSLWQSSAKSLLTELM